LYTVRYGISEAHLKAINPKENILSTYKSNVKSNYIIYSKSTPEMYIWDNIRGNNFVFFDDVKPMKWEKESETKEVNQKVLSKATTKFRGRTYIAWYDAKAGLALSPWKFNGIDGLVYEMYDENRRFSWELKSIENLSTTTPINPFIKITTSEMQAFRSYPDLKYGIVYNPNEFGVFLAVKQERNGLEIQFEWEK
jgi:GLPGLI family protein